jgi:hypothetical protein
MATGALGWWVLTACILVAVELGLRAVMRPAASLRRQRRAAAARQGAIYQSRSIDAGGAATRARLWKQFQDFLAEEGVRSLYRVTPEHIITFVTENSTAGRAEARGGVDTQLAASGTVANVLTHLAMQLDLSLGSARWEPPRGWFRPSSGNPARSAQCDAFLAGYKLTLADRGVVPKRAVPMTDAVFLALYDAIDAELAGGKGTDRQRLRLVTLQTLCVLCRAACARGIDVLRFWWDDAQLPSNGSLILTVKHDKASRRSGKNVAKDVAFPPDGPGDDPRCCRRPPAPGSMTAGRRSCLGRVLTPCALRAG